MPRAKTWEEYKVECEAVAKTGITILGWVGEWKGALTMLKCCCEVHGVWCTTKINNFKSGTGCPGCGRNSNLQSLVKTWENYAPKLEELAKIKGYTVTGYLKWEGSRTKLSLICPYHGEWNSTSISNFLRGHACPKCKVVAIKQSRTVSDERHIHKFIATGKFREGYIFKRNLDKVDQHGKYPYWDCICPVCSTDEYVKAGVCSGVFTAFRSDLLKGSIPCRCHPGYCLTKDQWEYRLSKECKNRGYTFKGWKGQYYNSSSKFIYSCPVHGERSVAVNSFLSGRGCSLCAGNTQQQCYINAVCDGATPVALKVGIANNSKVRLKFQNQKNLLQMQQIAVYKFPTVADCKNAERICLLELNCGILSRRELKDGWTETVALTDYDKVVSIYERFGGVRVDTFEEEEE